MSRVVTILIFLIFSVKVTAQTNTCSIVLNHFLITVDSNTYQALLSSEILNSHFAYSYERNKNWEGIYIIGQDNYIEIFHPNSVADENIPIGYTWICQSSLYANCTEKIDLPDNRQIEYTSDEYYDYLSVYTLDSSNLMTAWEMNKNQYESWTKKTFYDSLKFETTDYNSPAESDSSRNYLFKNITGIQVKLNQSDSTSITEYLELIGYKIESQDQNNVRFTNSNDFVELHFENDIAIATVSTIYFDLNKPRELKRIVVGSSEILLDGLTGVWSIN